MKTLQEAKIGENKAILPHFRTTPIKVKIEEWTRDPFGKPSTERLVYFAHGTKKDPLSEVELRGAKFLA